MGIDYQGVGGIGIEVVTSVEQDDYLDENEIELDEYLDEMLSGTPYEYECGGNSYSGVQRYYVFLSENILIVDIANKFKDMLDFMALKGFEVYDSHYKFTTIKDIIISDMHVY